MVVIGLTGWTGAARFIRAEFLKLKQLDFITALRALGASKWRIIFMHMIPNAMAPVLVSAVFGIAGAILTESSLSFLGFGVPPPKPSWGQILSQSRDYIEFAWWLTVFPGVAIFISITAYNLVGDGLRDAMDPKLFR
jgi:peptide/nickel transport system permease protein